MPIKINRDRYIITFLIILLLVSLLGNFFLYQQLKNTYLNLYKVSLNPIGISRYKDRIEPDVPNKSRVVFYGDSRAFQWRSLEKDNNFHFINRGVSGQTSAQVLWRFEADVTELNPKVIVLQVGINDLRMLPDAPKTRQDIVKDCEDNIAQIIDRAHSIKADIIVTTIFPLGSGNISLKSRPFWPSKEEIEQSINEVNQYIRTLDNNYLSASPGGRVIVFDAYSLLKKEDKDKVKYYRDLLHINQQGYQLLNQKLKSILNNIKTES